MPDFPLQAYQQQGKDLEDVIEAAFYRLDCSDSGTITLADLRHVLPPSLSDAEVKELLTRADPNHDGVLDLGEFRALMKMTEEAERIKSTQSDESFKISAAGSATDIGYGGAVDPNYRSPIVTISMV